VVPSESSAAASGRRWCRESRRWRKDKTLGREMLLLLVLMLVLRRRRVPSAAALLVVVARRRRRRSLRQWAQTPTTSSLGWKQQ
jgi:hypothetical protein